MPSTLLLNGRIYAPEESPQPTAIGIRDGRIAAIGSDGDLRNWHSGAGRIDLEGRAVFPGFVDSHIHLLSHGLTMARIDLKGVASLQQCLRIIRDHAEALPVGAWARGRGWDANIWAEGRPPTRQDLDSACPDRPAALNSVDGHALWCNSEALRMASIGPDTPDPEGGRIFRDPTTGEPTGLLAERANGLVAGLMPPPSSAERRTALQKAIDSAFRAGLTGIHDCNGEDMRKDLQALREAGAPLLRFWLMVPASGLDRVASDGRKTGEGDAFFRTGALKVFADGALGPRTAAMLEPYEETDNTGVVVTGRDALTDTFTQAHAHGLQVACHAIGDRAVRNVLDAIQGALEAVPGTFRPRVEHAQILHPDDIPRFAQLGAIASMQPIHATADMWIADSSLGGRARFSYAWKSLLESGARLAFGSDCPVEPLSVLAGIHAAVTRQRPGGDPPGGWRPQERLSIHEAIHAYTLGAAYAAGEEAEKGSIEPGKLADLTVLSKDLTAISPEEILQTDVAMTLIGGKIVYDGR